SSSASRTCWLASTRSGTCSAERRSAANALDILRAEVGTMETALELRDIMGVAVVAASTQQVCAHLDDELSAGRPVRLAFLNAHTSNLVAADEEFGRVLAGFTVLNDGV